MNVILKRALTTPKKRGEVLLISPQERQNVIKSQYTALLIPVRKRHATQRK